MTTIKRDGLEVALRYVVRGASVLESDEGGLFDPDCITVSYERNGSEWTLDSIRITGFLSGVSWIQFKSLHRTSANAADLPVWASEFVEALDPDVELRNW